MLRRRREIQNCCGAKQVVRAMAVLLLSRITFNRGLLAAGWVARRRRRRSIAAGSAYDRSSISSSIEA